MKITLVGDVFLGGDLKSKSLVRPTNLIPKENFLIGNLEQPISDNSFIENKSTLFTGTEGIEKLLDFGFNSVSLANNHIHDKGNQGIIDTVAHLKNANIGFFGADKNIEKARNYFHLENIYFFSYCEFNKTHLREVKIASESEPGCAPARLDIIFEDLKKIPNSSKAIIYLHWGKENTWFPPHEDIIFMKSLLNHDKVLTVVGSHSHMPQGMIKVKNKIGFMSLGNFLFPNFYMHPPSHLYDRQPDVDQERVSKTKRYHQVYDLTYKSWKLFNRFSIVVEFDSSNLDIKYKFAYQNKHDPQLKPANLFSNNLLMAWTFLLSCIYSMPGIIYNPIEKIISTFNLYKNFCLDLFLMFKKKGFEYTLIFFKDKIANKIFRNGK